MLNNNGPENAANVSQHAKQDSLDAAPLIGMHPRHG